MQIEVIERPEVEPSVKPSRFGEQVHLKNILVPTDFSAESVKALHYGVALSQQFDATLWLVHIIEPAPAFGGFEGIPIVVETDRQVQDAEARMAEFAAKNIPADVAVTSLVRSGSIVGEISALAKARNLDLAIISTHARTGINRALFGSMAEKILHHAPCPVLIVREQEHEFLADSNTGKAIQLNRILVPLDFSDCAKKAVRYAQALANQFNAQIFCVHVLEPEKPMIVFETEGFRKTHEMEARKEMDALLEQIRPAVEIEAEIKSGAPHHEIVDLAERRQIDLIILGEHSHSGMKRFWLGSTTDEIVKNAHCPVLVVREIEHEFVE
jgi:nucleotide-binding universal stress UspA family protein